MTIERYSFGDDFGEPGIVPDHAGDYVEYAAHLALVAAAYRDAAGAVNDEATYQVRLSKGQYAKGIKYWAYTDWASRKLMDAWRDVLARTPADAEAHLTAIERAAYERGVMEAAATINRGGLHTSADYSDCILALLTQEGR